MRRLSKKITAGIMVVSLLCSLGTEAGISNAAKKAKLSKKKLTLKVGTKKKLKVKFAKKKVKWSSNKKSVATVSKKGIVKAKKIGKAVITAKVGKKKYKCKVTVIAQNTASTDSPVATNYDVIVPSLIPAASQTPSVTLGPGTSTVPTQEPTAGIDSTKEPEVSAEPTKEPESTVLPEVTPGSSAEPSKVPETSSQPEVSIAPEESAVPESSPTVDANDLSMSEGSGTYTAAFTLTMESAAGNTIYYTTDGSDPRTSTTRKTYSNGVSITSRDNDANVLSAVSPNLFDTMNYSISGNTVNSKCIAPSNSAVDKCTVIRAVSCGSDGNYSKVVTNTYFIGKMSEHIDNAAQSANAWDGKLSVISITMDKNDLFDHDTGIYVKGKYFEDSVAAYIAEHGSLNGVGVESDLTSNFKQKGREWERECHIEYFETDGTNTTCELQQDCGIRIQGNYSRENVQKSFRLYAREDYGVKNFKYNFFGDELIDADGEPMDKFKTLVLRNGGNDAFNYKYKDIFTQSFVHDRAYETLYGRPCVVYLDGEYWGYYILQSDLSDNFLQNERGVEKDNVIVYKGSDEKKYADYKYKLDEGEIPEGETEDYYLKDTLAYLDGSKDFSDDAVYQEFCNTYVDEQSAVDYFATMVYLNNGWDWPDKNWSIWRTTVVDETNPYSDNKWRFCLFDLDLTAEPTWSGSDTGSWSGNNISNLADKSSSNVMKKFFGHLMDNATYREKLSAAIEEIGTQNYAYSKVSASGAVYKTAYGVLYNQFNQRFNSNYAVWSVGGDNYHNNTLNFFNKRGNYISSLKSYISAWAPVNVENPEPVNNVLKWEGSWTRGASTNYTTSLTTGISIVREDNSYIQITVDDWSVYTNPVIKLTVADGYSSGCRTHIWDDGKSMDRYIYENEEPWVGQEIAISALKGKTFYINVNDCTLTKFEIYDKN